jgi:hypothetical protein
MGVFGRRIRGWLPRDPIAAGVPAAPGQRMIGALQSLGVSVGVCGAIILSAYAAFQFSPPSIALQFMPLPFTSGFEPLMFGSAFAAAILYASVSIRSFHSRFLGTLLRVLRNILIAVPAGFLFTIATSALYSNHPTYGLAPGYTILGIQFWSYFNFLFSVGDGPVWSCLAFVVLSAFGLEYTRRRRRSFQGLHQIRTRSI